jgi:DNA-binding Lrp family transcriptional regulator
MDRMDHYIDKNKGPIDNLDEKIIELLRMNSRFTNKAIGLVLNVSEGTVRRRIKLLEQKKIISRYTIETSEQKEAIVLLKYDSNLKENVLQPLRKISQRVYEVAGKSDIAVLITYRSLIELNDILDRIREIKGIKNTETMIRLK